MALYKNGSWIGHLTSEAFDKVYTPGTSTPHSGIYKCLGCNDEVASNVGNPLPPQNHHQHSTNQGAIRWQLAVFAQTK